jgi:hypothetical protein
MKAQLWEDGNRWLKAHEKSEIGWVIVGLIAFFYALLYAFNLWLPLAYNNYTARIWDWSQVALAVAAAIVLVAKWKAIELRNSLVGLALGILSGLSNFIHHPDVVESLLEGVIVWFTFMGGTVLFKELETPRVVAFQPPWRKIGFSLLFGIVLAIPLAVINNLYFYMNSGVVQFQNFFESAFAALSPGISEESIYRFFVLAACLSLLRASQHRRLALTVSILLAVVPHSLNHLPDLFLTNAAMGLFMLTVTSLLFGLPMAILQIYRNFESAVAFHWFIDFIRFLFGY